MQGGRLDRRITLQSAGTAQSPDGAVIDAWSDVAEVAAAKLEARGDERFNGEQIIGSVNRSFRIRWSNQVRGINATWRVVFEGVPHDISAIREVGRRYMIEIDCFARGENATVSGA